MLIPIGYDPKLDPASPEFDLEAYKAAIEEAGGMEALTEQVNERLKKSREHIAETMIGPAAQTKEQGERLLNTTVSMLSAALKGLSDFYNSDAYKVIKQAAEAVSAFVIENKDRIEKLTGSGELQALAPFLEAALIELADDPDYADCTLEDLLDQGFDADGNPVAGPFLRAIERARQIQAQYAETEGLLAEIEQTAEELPRITTNPTDKINYPLDKPNNVIWNLIAGALNNGQLIIDTSRRGSKQDAVILYGINRDKLPAGLTITKQLTPFDKRCYIAAAALFNAGNEILSATQVYYMMGNTTPPNKNDLQKVNDSLTKMAAAHIFIDNQKEAQAAKGYDHFRYDASLLPLERISAYINGQLTESAIHLFREPPLMSFARQRNQITTVSRQLLESPVSKTDANLRIDDYLLERIGHMKNGKGKAPRKMLFTTIYANCDIITAKQKQRAPEKIRRYLDYYKKCKWITDYAIDADGITIIL